jgi:hypothetical protein
VSAEAVNGYLEFARAALGGEGRGMAAVLERLSGQIHPLVLGGAYRSRMQMRMIGRRLLGRQIKDDASIERVLEFLCSDSGSHDYTIYQREARDELGLRVEPAGETGYRILRALQLDFTGELELLKPFDSQAVLGRQTTAYYVLRGGLLESVAGGSHVHRTRGRVWQQKVQIQPGVHESMIMNEQKFEGWCHDV